MPAQRRNDKKGEELYLLKMLKNNERSLGCTTLDDTIIDQDEFFATVLFFGRTKCERDSYVREGAYVLLNNMSMLGRVEEVLTADFMNDITGIRHRTKFTLRVRKIDPAFKPCNINKKLQPLQRVVPSYFRVTDDDAPVYIGGRQSSVFGPFRHGIEHPPLV
jgi:hypothetical protein